MTKFPSKLIVAPKCGVEAHALTFLSELPHRFILLEIQFTWKDRHLRKVDFCGLTRRNMPLDFLNGAAHVLFRRGSDPYAEYPYHHVCIVQQLAINDCL